MELDTQVVARESVFCGRGGLSRAVQMPTMTSAFSILSSMQRQHDTTTQHCVDTTVGLLRDTATQHEIEWAQHETQHEAQWTQREKVLMDCIAHLEAEVANLTKELVKAANDKGKAVQEAMETTCQQEREHAKTTMEHLWTLLESVSVGGAAPGRLGGAGGTGGSPSTPPVVRGCFGTQ